MNHAVYVFGNLGTGYTQFPEDPTRRIFESAANMVASKVQISVRRDGNLLYYIYTRQLDVESENKYIAVVISFNGVYVNKIKSLFELFDKIITSMVVNGDIIEFSEKGDILPKSISLYTKHDEINRIIRYIDDTIAGFEKKSSFKVLPPINYGISSSERFKLTFSSSAEYFDRALADYHCIDITYKGSNEKTPLNSYIRTLKDLSGKVDTLTNSLSEANKELEKVRRQKKRTTIVTILSLSIMGIVLAFIVVGTNLNDEIRGLNYTVKNLKTEIAEKQETIDNQQNTISSYAEKNRNLTDEVNSLNAQLQNKQRVIDDNKKKIASLQNQISSLQTKLYAKNSELSSWKKTLSTTKQDKDYYQKLYSEKNKEVQQLKQKISSLESQVATLSQNQRRRR